MGIGKRIKEARNAKNMTQEDLAKLLGVTKGAVANYENETSHPKEPIMYKLIDALCVDANYLFQDVVKLQSHQNDISVSEYEHIKKYRFISEHLPGGTETVDYILDHEYKEAKELEQRLEELREKAERITSLEASVEKLSSKTRLYIYMHKIAAAGTGFYFDDIPTETIAAPYMEGADFIIGVSGDSMEPTFHDGDLVYVEKRQIVETGDIGLFMVDNECYIKEAGEKGLISHNKKYPMIPGSDRIICVGKVLGKVESN